MEETVECLECGWDFKRITITHLKTHSMDFDDYLEKYPGAELVSGELKERHRKTMSEMDMSGIMNEYYRTHPEFAENQSEIMYQYYADNPEAIEKLKGPRPHICGENNPAKRPDVKKKISDAVSGDKNPAKRPDVKKKIAASVQKLYEDPEYRARFQGENNPMFGRTGENSPLWQGGLSYGKYCEKFNFVFKEMIRALFGRRCFLCGITEEENGKKLDVHHVNYDKDCLCNSQCEFVPLCRKCHARTNGKYIRRYWEDLIMCHLYPDRITMVDL